MDDTNAVKRTIRPTAAIWPLPPPGIERRMRNDRYGDGPSRRRPDEAVGRRANRWRRRDPLPRRSPSSQKSTPCFVFCFVSFCVFASTYCARVCVWVRFPFVFLRFLNWHGRLPLLHRRTVFRLCCVCFRPPVFSLFIRLARNAFCGAWTLPLPHR